MPSFNKVILMGNLTRDPEMKYTANQMAVVNFGIAVNHKYKTAGGEAREDVLFVDCAAFGKTAETINQYCQKGKPLLIEGRLKLDNWEDKQGQKRSKHTVVVDSFQFVGAKSEGDSSDQRPETQYPRTRASIAGQERTGPEVLAADGTIPDDQIPF